MVLAQRVTPDMMGELVTYKEAIKLLGIAEDSLKGAISRGRLHPVKIEGLRTKFLHRGEIEAYRERRPWFPPPGVTSSQGALRGAAIPQIGASGAPLVTMPDLVSYGQMLLREGQQAASAVAGAAVESAMRPIGEALRPISEAIAESQRPAPSPADITKVDELLASAKAQMGMMLLQFIEAMRPMVEAINGGRQVTREDVAPLMALMELFLSDGLRESAIGPGLADAIAHVPDLVKARPDALAPNVDATHREER